jgi:hypothetical protein
MNKQQFRILYREFLFRMVDLEILAPQGEMSKLLGQFAALLIFVSLWLSSVAGMMSAGRTNSVAGLLISWVAGHFLIATTMLAVGLFAVMSWDSTFPNRRDVLVLSPLPIRARTLLSAKVAAVATALGITVLSLNIFTGIIAPVASASAIGVVPLARSFAAYWIATFAAGAFIFSGVLTVQGLAQLLPRQQFLRVSSFLQMAFLVLLLTVYFLQPPFSDAADLLRNQRMLYWIPSYWYLGLFQQLAGPTLPGAGLLAGRALIGLAIVVSGAVVSYLVCYWRTLRRIAEQPDILPTRGGLRWLPRFGNSFHTAVAQFSIRTLLRSRQHRVILSFYLGIALGLAILLSSGTALQQLSLENGAWYRVNMRLAKASDIVLCFAVLGIRVVFSMPLEIRANWIFRVTSHPGADACVAGSRRSLYTLALLPVWIAAAALFFWLWPREMAAEHLALLSVLGICIAELGLYGFHKIPFTCSYLPGKLHFNMAIAYLFLFLITVTLWAELEMRALSEPALYAAVLVGLMAAAAIARWRTTAQARSKEAVVRFDEAAEPAIHALDLHRDGVTPLQ